MKDDDKTRDGKEEEQMDGNAWRINEDNSKDDDCEPS